MMFVWNLVTVIIIHFVKWSDQSIAGMTFMDHFDFESRYRNLHECDPLYWHPLHLPENCIQLYEKLIRSGVAARYPFRVVKEREDAPVHLGYPSHEKSSSRATSYSYDGSDTNSESCEYSNSASRFNRRTHRNNHNVHKESNRHSHSHEGGYWPTIYYETNFRHPWLSPYEQVLNHIRTDVKNQPREPSIEVIPNLGPAAVYRQPISKISEMAIKKIAKAHKPVQLNEDGDVYEISLTKYGKGKQGV